METLKILEQESESRILNSVEADKIQKNMQKTAERKETQAIFHRPQVPCCLSAVSFRFMLWPILTL